MVEPPAVNRLVAGSSPARGAIPEVEENLVVVLGLAVSVGMLANEYSSFFGRVKVSTGC